MVPSCKLVLIGNLGAHYLVATNPKNFDCKNLKPIPLLST